MEPLVELSEMELKLAFAASCIEGAAGRCGVSYREMYRRMQGVKLIDRYILPSYNVLHTMSREHVTDDVLECLANWEAQK